MDSLHNVEKTRRPLRHSTKTGPGFANTNDEHRDRVPHWSSDGQRIAFYSNRGGRYQIWSINPDGSGLHQLTDERLGNAVYPAWSPDGSQLSYVVADRNLSAASFVLRLSDGFVEALPPFGEQGAWFEAFSWSPDGRRLAGHRSSAAGPGRIYVYSFDLHRYERFTDFGFAPRWLSDSQRLVFGGASPEALRFILSTLGLEKLTKYFQLSLGRSLDCFVSR